MGEVTKPKKVLFVSVLIVMCVFGLQAQARYGGGTGEPNDPYLIFDANQMNAIGADSNDWDKHFKLMADIDLSTFTGREFNIIASFTGVFDGNDHTISNFTYYSNDSGHIGLFGHVSGPNAHIKDLRLIDPNFDAVSSVGLLVGHNLGRITNCYVEAGSVSGNDNIGGLVGHNDNGGIITNCYSTGKVVGGSCVGGLVGYNLGTITNCYSGGDVSGNQGVGGLVGETVSGTITNCYSSASISGSNNVGGLVGGNWGTIYTSYSRGCVSGTTDVGGLVGWNKGGVFVSFWDIQTSGQTTSAGGRGKTTVEMQDPNTYIGWGCELVWTLDAGVDYPRLVWENKPGQLINALLSDFVVGNGTQANPYLIYTAQQLNLIGLFACEWDKHFKLMADIDLSAYTKTGFNIIGIYYYNPFTGIFDGNDKKIFNFTYTSTRGYGIGLFGSTDGSNAEIKHMVLIDPTVDAGTGDRVGSLVGYNCGRITNCYVEGASVSGDQAVGGLVGKNEGTITDCYVEDGSISGSSAVAGLVAANYSTITNCYATGSVLGSQGVGGLVGYNKLFDGAITECYSTANVTGGKDVGGLVGHNEDIIFNCYSTGSVTGTTDVGGLVGYNDYWGEITGSFWDIQTSGWTTSAGGMGRTTVEMRDPNTFMKFGWDFVGEPDGPSDIWAEPAGGGYPVLWWQLSPLPTLPDFSGGTGTTDGPYLISTANDLNRIGHNPRLMRAHFKSINDIDLSGVDFYNIGNESYPYTCVFDGNSHRISNFRFTSTGRDYIGLFGHVSGPNAEVKDLRLIDPDVDAGTAWLVGSLVGALSDGAITGCYIEGGRVSGYGTVGGLVGWSSGSEILNCYATADVSGQDRVGGLVGHNASPGPPPPGGHPPPPTNCSNSQVAELTPGEPMAIFQLQNEALNIGGYAGFGEPNSYSYTITNCYSAGSVSGRNYVGGLVGWNSNGEIFNCYATSNISGQYYVGGFAGYTWMGTIANCYSTGSVTACVYVGGMVGENDNGTISDCYSASSVTGTTNVGGLIGYNKGIISTSFWDTQTSGPNNMCGSQGIYGTGCDNANGKTTSEMQTETTFTDAGWDFVGESINGTDDIWDICEGTNYPKLAWQITLPGDFICPDGVEMRDFAILAGQWRQSPGEPSADIAPDGGDGIVDRFDLAALLDNWLTEGKVRPLTGRASNPKPPNGATGVGTIIDLNWTDGRGATSHDVYFGTSSPPPFACNQTATTFDPGTMAYYTTYYWRIDEVNPLGTITGTIWNFTTIQPPPP